MPETGGGTELRGGPLPAALARFDLGRRGELAPESRAIDDGGAAARVGLGCRSQLAPEQRPTPGRTFPLTGAVDAPRPRPGRAFAAPYGPPRREAQAWMARVARALTAAGEV